MTRLPVEGGDDGTWGYILNDFLRVSHNIDGTLKNGTIAATSLQDSTITPEKISSNTPTSGQVLSYNGTGFEWVNASNDPAVGGDLSGTASNAQIVAGAITNNEVNATANIAQSKIANLTSDLSGKLTATNNLSDVPTPATARTNLGLGDSATRNVGTTAGTVAAGDDARFNSIGESLHAFLLMGA